VSNRGLRRGSAAGASGGAKPPVKQGLGSAQPIRPAQPDSREAGKPFERGSPEVIVRKARSPDVTALTELDRRCFPAADRFPRRTWRHLLTSAARNRSCISIVAERDGAVVGAAAVLLRRDSTIARLYTLAVDPIARGGGLGRRLIAEILHRVPARCDTVSLEVRADNRAARSLYEALGLQKSADLPAYYADYADAVRLRGPLKPIVHQARLAIARI